MQIVGFIIHLRNVAFFWVSTTLPNQEAEVQWNSDAWTWEAAAVGFSKHNESQIFKKKGKAELQLSVSFITMKKFIKA